MDHIKEPMYCDEPFTLPFPTPPGLSNVLMMRWCLICPPCCIIGWVLHFQYSGMKVRGIPRDAKPFSDEETKDLLKKLEGNWKIVLLESASRNTEAFTDVLVKDDYMIISGGESISYSKDRGGHGIAVKNPEQKQALRFFRDSSGAIYCDFAGSTMTKMDFEGGEVELDNALGMKVMFQRLWKQQGSPPPQQVGMAV